MKDFLKDYLNRMGNTLAKSSLDDLNKAIDILLDARKRSRWIFAAGNGGSSATASHFTNDFVKGLSIESKKRFKVMALNDCVPVLTALSNDYSYSVGFSEQLKNYASAGDVLVVYSGSGNSPNVVNAARYAKENNMKVIAFTGRNGGELNKYADVNCVAPTSLMEEIEDVHMVWEHAFVCGLREIIQKEDAV